MIVFFVYYQHRDSASVLTRDSGRVISYSLSQRRGENNRILSSCRDVTWSLHGNEENEEVKEQLDFNTGSFAN